jgi:hypothetical protein
MTIPEVCRRWGCNMLADWCVLLERKDGGGGITLWACHFHAEGMRRLANELYLFCAFDSIDFLEAEEAASILPPLPT